MFTVVWKPRSSAQLLRHRSRREGVRPPPLGRRVAGRRKAQPSKRGGQGGSKYLKRCPARNTRVERKRGRGRGQEARGATWSGVVRGGAHPGDEEVRMRYEYFCLGQDRLRLIKTCVFSLPNRYALPSSVPSRHLRLPVLFPPLPRRVSRLHPRARWILHQLTGGAKKKDVARKRLGAISMAQRSSARVTPTRPMAGRPKYMDEGKGRRQQNLTMAPQTRSLTPRNGG